MKKQSSVFAAIMKAEKKAEKEKAKIPCKQSANDKTFLEVLEIRKQMKRLSQKLDDLSFEKMQEYDDYWQMGEDFYKWVRLYHKKDLNAIKPIKSKCYNDPYNY